MKKRKDRINMRERNTYIKKIKGLRNVLCIALLRGENRVRGKDGLLIQEGVYHRHDNTDHNYNRNQAPDDSVNQILRHNLSLFSFLGWCAQHVPRVSWQ